jgi:CheY-like chemotaxis protein
MNTKNRKKHRVLLQKDIVINNIIKGIMLDLSEGGMFIHTQAEFIRGAAVDLSFTLNERPFTVKGGVQHIQPGIGIGIKFLNLSVEDYQFIKNLSNIQTHVISEEKHTKSILLVDDNEQTRSMYMSKLMRDGLTIIGAQNGTEALKRMQETKFDLVVLEIWMEGIDGFKILQLMKVNPELREIPVIVLSARSTPADLDKAIMLGAKDYLVKMVTSPAKLSEKVKSVLNG